MSGVLPSLVARTARWRRRSFQGLEVVVFVLVLVLLALVLLQVFTRYVMDMGLPWTEEVARMVLVWTVMLGAAIAMDRKQHYVITVLSDHFRGWLRLGMLVATNVMGIVFLVALVRYGADYMAANMKTTYVSTQFSRGWVYLSLPVGSAMMIVSLVVQSFEAWFERNELPPLAAAEADNEPGSAP
jgi:TRAP-type C4-dicarboxylate transport system permease small subunit